MIRKFNKFMDDQPDWFQAIIFVSCLISVATALTVLIMWANPMITFLVIFGIPPVVLLVTFIYAQFKVKDG